MYPCLSMCLLYPNHDDTQDVLLVKSLHIIIYNIYRIQLYIYIYPYVPSSKRQIIMFRNDHRTKWPICTKAVFMRNLTLGDVSPQLALDENLAPKWHWWRWFLLQSLVQLGDFWFWRGDDCKFLNGRQGRQGGNWHFPRVVVLIPIGIWRFSFG